MAVNKSRVLSKVRRGGIATSLSGALNDRADFLRSTFESQSKYLQEEGLKRRSKIKGLQTGFKEAADFLDNYGMDEKKISKLIQSDPDAFLKFAQKAMKYQESGETLTPDLLNDAHDFSESSSYKDVTPQSAIEMMLPIYNTSSDPVVREKKTFLASLGADLFQPAATVANRQIEGASILGTTGGDIMSSLGEPLYKSGSGGVTTDYSGFKKISSLEINSDRTRMINEYDQLLAGKIKSLPIEEATKLQKKYEGLPDSSKLEKLILDPMFGPEIAHRYNQKSSDIAARFLIGDKAFDAVTNYKVPSSETSDDTASAETKLVPIPENSIEKEKDGVKAYFVDGVVVLTVDVDGNQSEGKQALEVVETLGIPTPKKISLMDRPEPAPKIERKAFFKYSPKKIKQLIGNEDSKKLYNSFTEIQKEEVKTLADKILTEGNLSEKEALKKAIAKVKANSILNADQQKPARNPISIYPDIAEKRYLR